MHTNLYVSERVSTSVDILHGESKKQGGAKQRLSRVPPSKYSLHYVIEYIIVVVLNYIHGLEHTGDQQMEFLLAGMNVYVVCVLRIHFV